MAKSNRSNKGRGGRAVDGSGLENRQGASPRGFESHPLRQSILDFRFWILDCWENPTRRDVRGQQSDQRRADDIREKMRRDIHSRERNQHGDKQERETDPPTGESERRKERS